MTGPGFTVPVSADLVFECAGVPQTVTQALRIVRHGGTVVTVALADEPAPVDITVITQKEINLLGSYAYINEFEEAISLVSSGKIHLEPLITHIYPLNQIQEAFETQLDTSKSVKVLIDCRS